MNENNENKEKELNPGDIHLRGGVFLFLLVPKRSRKISRKKMLGLLINIFNNESDINGNVPSVHTKCPENDEKTNVSKYVSLETDLSDCFGFNGSNRIRSEMYETFRNEGFGEDHNRLLSTFSKHIVKRYLYNTDERRNPNYDNCKSIVKRLLWIIIHDENIDDDEPFYILEHENKPVLKKELRNAFLKSTTEEPYSICLEAFLLGVWFFAAFHENIEKSSVTSSDLIAPKPGNSKPSEYNENVEKLVNEDIEDIELTFYDPDKPVVNPSETEDNPTNEGGKDAPPPPGPQPPDSPKSGPPKPEPPKQELPPNKPLSDFTSLSEALEEDNLSERLLVVHEPRKRGSDGKNIVFICGRNGCGKTYAAQTWINNNLSNDNESRYQECIRYDYTVHAVYRHTGESSESVKGYKAGTEANNPEKVFKEYKNLPQNIRRALVIDSFFEPSPQGWQKLFDNLKNLDDPYTDVFVLTSCDPKWFYIEIFHHSSSSFPYFIFRCDSPRSNIAKDEFLKAAGISKGSKEIDELSLDFYCLYYRRNISILRDTGKLIQEKLVACKEFNKLAYDGAGFDDLFRVARNNSRSKGNKVLSDVWKKVERCYGTYEWLLNERLLKRLLNRVLIAPEETEIAHCILHILRLLWQLDYLRAEQLEARKPEIDGSYNLRFHYYNYSKDHHMCSDLRKKELQHEMTFDGIKKYMEIRLREARDESIRDALNWLCSVGAVQRRRNADGTEGYSIDKDLMVAMDILGFFPSLRIFD